MERRNSFIPGLNRGIRIFFSEFVRVSLARPAHALFFGRTVLLRVPEILAAPIPEILAYPSREVRNDGIGATRAG